TPSIAVDAGGRRMVTFVESEPGRLWATTSTDGVTWSAPVKVADGVNDSEGRSRAVVREMGGKFYVAYPAGGQVYVVRLDVDAGSTNPPTPPPPTPTPTGPGSLKVAATTLVSPGHNPDVAVDRARSQVHVVWATLGQAAYM